MGGAHGSGGVGDGRGALGFWEGKVQERFRFGRLGANVSKILKQILKKRGGWVDGRGLDLSSTG